MTSHISAGNALYLYQLLKDAFGQGTQIFLPRIEEALEDAGIAPYDLDVPSVEELLEKLDFVSLTKFKGGRIYATLHAQPDFDEALALLEATPAAEGAKKSGKPWKRKKSQLKPIRPAHREVAHAEKKDMETPKETPDITPAPTAQTTEKGASVERASIEEPPQATETTPSTTSSPIAESARVTETTPSTASSPATEATSAAAPAVPAQASPKQAAGLQPRTPPQSAAERSLPQEFLAEVRIPDKHLQQLALALPFDADALSTLEEDWQVARATGAVSFTQSDLHFPLRYQDGEGEQIEIYLTRSKNGVSSKRWELSQIKAAELTSAEQALDAQATPTTQDFWMGLSAYALPPYLHRNLALELSERLHFTSWQAVCESVAQVAAPEMWGAPEDDDLPFLREYLTVNFVRALEQKRIVDSADGHARLWNTGLLTTDYRDVFCLMHISSPEEPAEFVAALPADDKRLSNWHELPAPASYITSLEDIFLPYNTTLDKSVPVHISTHDCTQALAYAKANYRDIAPVWDPQTGQNYLLLPLPTNGTTDWLQTPPSKALVTTYEKGTVKALTTLSLRDAYACARVVSQQLPTWLSK